MKRAVPLLLVVFASLLALCQSSSCPSLCQCSAGGIIRCEGKEKLSAVPVDLPEDTQVLHLKGNDIGSLEGLRPLRHLNTLILSHNRVRSIPENFLDRFPSLRRLSLSHNRLVSLGSLAGHSSFLQALELRHNHLSHISRDSLTSLPRLLSLDLSHNHLRSLPTSLKDYLPQLKTLHLHSNPLNCDCRLRGWLPLLASSTTSSHPHCAAPTQKTLKTTSSSLSQCVKPTVETQADGEKLLSCPYGNDTVWLFKEVDLEDSAASIFTLHGNGSLVLPSRADIQSFSCSSENRPVLAHSPRRLRSLSKSAPLFTLRPIDSTYREGAAVKLHCEVTGVPPPVIAWRFKSLRLVSTRKHEMTNGGQQLRIYPFLESDTGSYTCEATNAYGTVSATATLSLVSSVPPQITLPPKSLKVSAGDSVSFRCEARGTPKPKISWFFDGAEIGHIRGRLSVSVDGTKLSISGVTRKDDGVYSCMAGNPVGAMTAEARLSVHAPPQFESELTDETLKGIVEQATENVNRAIENTRVQLTQEGVRSVSDLRRLFRFAIPSQAVELSRAREIYEESVRLVQAHVQNGLNLTGVLAWTGNVSYESVLAVSHVATLMELAGCQPGQFRDTSCADKCFHSKYRSYDGQCNNLADPLRGVSQWPLRRLLPPIYENGFNTPVGWDEQRLYYGFPKPNAREVSRQLVSTRQITPHTHLSSFVMQWGQLVDHDLTHTATPVSRNAYTSGALCNRTCENVEPCFNIRLPPGDPKLKSGNWHHRKWPCIEFERSGAICGSGETSLLFQRVSHREQMNLLTSYLDGSFLYGSTEIQAIDLRDFFADNGFLRYDIVSSTGKPFLPFEKDSPMDCRRNFSQPNPVRCFLAGDLRANEQLALTAMHTLFLREHNQIAQALGSQHNPRYPCNGERIFQESRKIVGAMIQKITYTDWLPIVLGGDALWKYLGEYPGYQPAVDATISNVFATAAFRFGHTLINPVLRRLGPDFSSIPEGDILLHQALFAPERLVKDGGIDPLLRGLFASPLKTPMPTQLLNDELTEMLFNRNHEVALDLAVMNIQRARDHGLPGYTEYRRWCNLTVPTTWDDIHDLVTDKGVVAKLKKLYGHPGNMDVWVGGITEMHLPGALVGPLFACLIGEQFRRLRDGDRFWYENEGVFTPAQLAEVKKASLARLLCDNGDAIDRVQSNVFMYPGASPSLYSPCSLHPSLNLQPWRNSCGDDIECASAPTTESPYRKRRRLVDAKVEIVDDEACEGGRRPHGEVWLEGSCRECSCKNGDFSCKNVCDEY